MLAVSWRAQSPGPAAEYRTTAAPTAVPDGDSRIDAVSSPNVTVVELTRIVAAPRLVVIDGPADSSVYTRAVQPEPDLAAGDVLVRLRFAEPVIAP
jgi:hypothetical protein